MSLTPKKKSTSFRVTHTWLSQLWAHFCVKLYPPPNQKLECVEMFAPAFGLFFWWGSGANTAGLWYHGRTREEKVFGQPMPYPLSYFVAVSFLLSAPRQSQRQPGLGLGCCCIPGVKSLLLWRRGSKKDREGKEEGKGRPGKCFGNRFLRTKGHQISILRIVFLFSQRYHL